jgi:transcriptional regulator with XRE-family HTH domain
MEIGGVSLTKVGELGRFIRDQRRTSRLSLRKMSQMAGISNPYLSQIERGLRRPSAEILQAIAKTLRISAETLYVKAGILEEREDSEVDTMSAILRDMSLSEKQKQVLIEIYHSFRHEQEPARPVNQAKQQPKRTAAAKKPPTTSKTTKRATTKRATA